jgi:hypothetical protein
MAVFPQGLSQVDQRCNAGERRVLHQLKRCLEDDYIVWHDVPIGPRARQPDFVVLSPRWGVLLLEVKDWRRSTLVAATRDTCELATARGRVTVAHPLRQARDVALELVDLMQRDPALVHGDGPFAGRLLFPYGWGVVFSGLRRAELPDGHDFDELFPPPRTLLRDDLEEAVGSAQFQHRLWGMFMVSYPHTLSLPQRDRIRWHLFPELRLAQQAQLDFSAEEPGSKPAFAPAPALPPLPDLMQVMDLQQEQVARGLGEGHRVVHGVAGSGKTMILIYRAELLARAARADQPILVLCFNRTLADRIESLLRQRAVDERVQVRTFHSWCQDLVRSYRLDAPQRDVLKGDAYFEALALAVERAVDTGRVPAGQYSALLIDEAHDFEDAWLRIAARMVSPATRSLLVLYDDAQSIYRVHQARRRNFSFSSVGIEARGRTSVLRLNYRNTAEVLALAVLCRTRDQMRPIEAALRRRGLALQSMNAQAFRHFDWRRPSIKLLTLHSAKGLEFALVCVAGLQAMPLRAETPAEAMRLLYVAMTRATAQLVLSAHGGSAGATPVLNSVRQALADVTRQFSSRDT